MEPKPRGTTPNISPGNSYDTETSFFRGDATIEILDRILPEISHRPNILLVGLGLKAEPLLCTYEPFKVAAHLQGKGIDYTMTLVDIFEDVIEDVRERKRLFLAYRHFHQDLRNSFEVSWKKYLADTGQPGRETFELEEGLKFIPHFWKSDTRYLEKGIAVADVSSQFRTKLASGEISLVHGDIAVADITGHGSYDYVELTNLLYLMSNEGQQLALANITASMRLRGRILMDDIGGYTGRPILTRFGGWLDGETMKQLGLEIEETISKSTSDETLLIRKVQAVV